MKKVLVFEHTEYTGALEKEFYCFCLRHQVSLIKYLPVYVLCSIFRFFGVVSRKGYYEKRWSFLCSVKNLVNRIEAFWNKQGKKIQPIESGEEVSWISEYPDIVLTDLAKKMNVWLTANSYDIRAKEFLRYDSLYNLCVRATKGKKAIVYDQYRSKLRDLAKVNFIIVYNRKTFENEKDYLTYRIKHIAYTFFMLLMMGICLGLVSLYFGAAYFIMPMFLSYFKIPYIPFLNIFPVVFCIFLLYLVFNRVWASFLATSVITMIFTLINYYKLLIRNDPLLASDLLLFTEAANMAGKFEIQINWKIIAAVIACILGLVYAVAFVRLKMRSTRLRVAGIAVLVLIGVYSFNNIYMNDRIYAATKNYDLINKWSATQVYISRGFFYPFIYSIKSSIDEPPEGYDKKVAAEMLYSYEYSDIDDDKKVDIIAIMLEAYNDFSKFESLEFNIDVYDYLHELQKESYSGELVTNIFVGGTVDTERCFLTGYTTLFNFRTNVNSYVHYFKEQGYTVEGSHPCYGWFYNRQNVNRYLGFDDYYFYENYYSPLSGNKIAGDDILFPHIIKLYEENKEKGKPYFSFNVTYQNHGPYSTERRADMDYVKNKGYTEEVYNVINNYIAGIYKTNMELKSFIDYFRVKEDPVVVILFGDHNPWMGDNNSVYAALGIDFDLSTEEGFYDYYNTPYIIWANDSAKRVLGNDFVGEGPSTGPYFLMNVFFDLAGYKGNEYMKISNELRKIVDVVHLKGYYREAGVLTTDLSPQARQKLNDFLKVQYYWRKNFRSTKP